MSALISETITGAPAKSLKIFFQSLDAAGHLSACFGLAQALVQRGHQVTFFLAASFKGQAAKFGCREVIFDDDDADSKKPKTKTKTEKTENPIKHVAASLLETGILGPKSSLEKVDLMSNPTFFEQTWNRLIARNSQIEAEMDAVNPDLFILDLFLILPTIQRRGIPYVCIFSGNPLFLYDHPSVPPGCSGYRTDSDPAMWTKFKKKFAQYTSTFKINQEKLNAHFNFVPEKFEQNLKNINTDFVISPYLNLVGYPKELIYCNEEVKLSNTFHYLDAFCRQESSTEFSFLKQIQEMPGKALIYFSLGSMGGYDVELLKRILSILGQTPHRYIVSKGLRSNEFELPANCWGEPYLPQTAILPFVDLVITHGGNNSFTEAFSFGKKMIVFPLFADQYDNGTRVVELGYGESFNPYDFKDEDLVAAIDRLLSDDKLTAKMEQVRERIVRENTKAAACEAIEKLVKTV